MTNARPTNQHLARRASASIGSIALLGVVVPIVLVRVAGWPLPSVLPDVGETLTAIQQQNPPDGLVIGTFACIAWLLWAQVAWAFVWELIVNTRRLANGLDVRPAPFVTAAVNGLVARVASGTVALSLLAASPAAAVALPIAPTPTVLEFSTSASNQTVAPQRAATERPVPAAQWRVAHGDTGWSIAESALGDGSRFSEVMALNSALRTPRDVVVGLTLALPEGAQIPQDRYPTESDEPKTAAGASNRRERSGAVHIVVESEHLWSISENALEKMDGGWPTDIETAAFLSEILDANAQTIEDPDRIHPGEQFVLPAGVAGTSPGVSEPDTHVPAENVVIVDGDHLWGLSEQRLETAAGTEPSNAEILDHVNTVINLNADIVEDPDLIYPGEVFAFPSIGSPPQASPEELIGEGTPAVPTEQPVPSIVQAAPAFEDSPSSNLTEDPAPTDGRSTLPYLLGLVGATVFASSLVAAIRARRSMNHTMGTESDSEQITELERTVTAAANMPLIRWAGQELSILVSELPSAVTSTSAPLAVEVGEAGIELLWDVAAPEAPHPWEATDGGAAWRLLFDADAPIPLDDLPPAIPALVTVGVRPGEGAVLLDLESFGSIAVTGDGAALQDFVRSLALELVSGSDLASADVVTVGFDVEASSHFPRIKTASEDEVVALLRSTAEQYDEMIRESATGNSFELRCVTGVGPGVVVAVVSAESCSRIDDLIELAGRRRGVVVVVVGESQSANGQIYVAGDGSCQIEPIGLSVQAPAFTKEAAIELSESLERWTEAEATAEEVCELEVANENTITSDAVSADSPQETEPESVDWFSDYLVDLVGASEELEDDDGWIRPHAPLVVRLLGAPKAPGFDLTARQIGLLGFIASKGGTAPAECVLDHLWADQSNARSRKTLWNLESETRSTVGPEILPHSPKNQPLRTNATTDVAIFEALVERARAVSSSRAIPLLSEALDLIAGPPFDHGHFEWARSIGVYDSARQMIEAAALQLCDMALEAGDLEAARRGIGQGLLGLGVNEPLYRSRMIVEAQLGDRAAVLRTYSELEERLEILFGDATPSAATRRLRDELICREALTQTGQHSA